MNFIVIIKCSFLLYLKQGKNRQRIYFRSMFQVLIKHKMKWFGTNIIDVLESACLDVNMTTTCFICKYVLEINKLKTITMFFVSFLGVEEGHILTFATYLKIKPAFVNFSHFNYFEIFKINVDSIQIYFFILLKKNILISVCLYRYFYKYILKSILVST